MICKGNLERSSKQVCRICSDYDYYRDVNGEWHECPRCSNIIDYPKNKILYTVTIDG